MDGHAYHIKYIYLVAIYAILYCLSCHFNFVIVFVHVKYLCDVILIHTYQQILVKMLLGTFQNFYLLCFSSFPLRLYSNMNNIDVNILLLEYSIRVFMMQQ